MDSQLGKDAYKQRVASPAISTIDKRQYMRFDSATSANTIELKDNAQISGLIDISRGGVAVRHSNNLKVGDVVPVQISCGDMEINADVKVLTANNSRAGAEFINLDRATANKLLYMNIMLEEAAGVQARAKTGLQMF